jgi:hypothetical protein
MAPARAAAEQAMAEQGAMISRTLQRALAGYNNMISDQARLALRLSNVSRSMQLELSDFNAAL